MDEHDPEELWKKLRDIPDLERDKSSVPFIAASDGAITPPGSFGDRRAVPSHSDPLSGAGTQTTSTAEPGPGSRGEPRASRLDNGGSDSPSRRRQADQESTSFWAQILGKATELDGKDQEDAMKAAIDKAARKLLQKEERRTLIETGTELEDVFRQAEVTTARKFVEDMGQEGFPNSARMRDAELDWEMQGYYIGVIPRDGTYIRGIDRENQVDVYICADGKLRADVYSNLATDELIKMRAAEQPRFVPLPPSDISKKPKRPTIFILVKKDKSEPYEHQKISLSDRLRAYDWDPEPD